MSFLGACTTAPLQPSPSRPEVPRPQLSPQAMGVTLSLSQRLSVERLSPDGQLTTDRLDALLEIDAESVHLAGLAMGQRVLSLQWRGQQLQSQRHPMLPAQVDETRILRDLQWVYANEDALRATLPTGWQLLAQPSLRELRLHEQTQLSVCYELTQGWAGRIVVDNRMEGYRLVIDSIDQNHPVR